MERTYEIYYGTQLMGKFTGKGETETECRLEAYERAEDSILLYDEEKDVFFYNSQRKRGVESERL